MPKMRSPAGARRLRHSAALNPFSTGRLNQAAGLRFEAQLKFAAMREDLLVIENGLRGKFVRGRFQPMATSLLDMIVIGDVSLGQIAVVDCKVFCAKRFGRSQLTGHQLVQAVQLNHRKMCSGFIVHLVEANHVGFYSGELLARGGARAGFGPEDGIALGTGRDFYLSPMWLNRSPAQEPRPETG